MFKHIKSKQTGKERKQQAKKDDLAQTNREQKQKDNEQTN